MLSGKQVREQAFFRAFHTQQSGGVFGDFAGFDQVVVILGEAVQDDVDGSVFDLAILN